MKLRHLHEATRPNHLRLFSPASAKVEPEIDYDLIGQIIHHVNPADASKLLSTFNIVGRRRLTKSAFTSFKNRLVGLVRHSDPQVVTKIMKMSDPVQLAPLIDFWKSSGVSDHGILGDVPDNTDRHQEIEQQHVSSTQRQRQDVLNHFPEVGSDAVHRWKWIIQNEQSYGPFVGVLIRTFMAMKYMPQSLSIDDEKWSGLMNATFTRHSGLEANEAKHLYMLYAKGLLNDIVEGNVNPNELSRAIDILALERIGRVRGDELEALAVLILPNIMNGIPKLSENLVARVISSTNNQKYFGEAISMNYMATVDEYYK